VLSPVLFCIYFFVLMNALQSSGYGYHVGACNVGVLKYADADDLVLLTCTQCNEKYVADV